MNTQKLDNLINSASKTIEFLIKYNNDGTFLFNKTSYNCF